MRSGDFSLVSCLTLLYIANIILCVHISMSCNPDLLSCFTGWTYLDGSTALFLFRFEEDCDCIFRMRKVDCYVGKLILLIRFLNKLKYKDATANTTIAIIDSSRSNNLGHIVSRSILHNFFKFNLGCSISIAKLLHKLKALWTLSLILTFFTVITYLQ